MSDTSTPIPVICDRCRAEGMAADQAFSAIPDILAFEPVPRRAHANGWTPEHQRAFIAALAITGSANQAARTIGRAAFGAERLRTARGGRSFAAAWDAALDLARDRELAQLHDDLSGLAADTAAKRDRLASLPAGGRGAASRFDDDEDPDAAEQEFREMQDRIRQRLLSARRLLLSAIADDPERRSAWEVLVGPVDWDKARRLQPQDDEPFATPNMHQPDMLLTAEAGLLADLTGGKDAMEEVRQVLIEHGVSTESKTNDGTADASAWSRDADPDRPACRAEGEDTFDVTNSVRDGSPSASPPLSLSHSVPVQPNMPRVRRLD